LLTVLEAVVVVVVVDDLVVLVLCTRLKVMFLLFEVTASDIDLTGLLWLASFDLAATESKAGPVASGEVAVGLLLLE